MPYIALQAVQHQLVGEVVEVEIKLAEPVCVVVWWWCTWWWYLAYALTLRALRHARAYDAILGSITPGGIMVVMMASTRGVRVRSWFSRGRMVGDRHASQLQAAAAAAVLQGPFALTVQILPHTLGKFVSPVRKGDERVMRG